MLALSLAALHAEDAPPTIATPAAATPASVTGTSTKLTVVGADDGGATTLLYAWTASGPAPVTFSATGSNAAKTVTATFKAPGDYVCTATVTDASGQTVTSSINVQVLSILASLAISPTSAVVNPGLTKLFAGTPKNQFGTVLAGEPLVWSSTSVSGQDGVDQSGLFTAGATPGAATVTVVDGAKSAKATIRINAAPTIALAPMATPFAGVSMAVSATGADSDDALSTLKYTWTATGPKAVSFSPNGTNASAAAVAKFAAVGDYVITVTVKDPAGLGASASQAISVQAVTTSVAVAPNATSTVVNPGATKVFTATVKDQFSAAIAGVPVQWSVDPAAAGPISATGVLTGGTPSQAVVTATASAVVGSAPVRVNAKPSVVLAPLDFVAGTTTALTATGSDPDDAATTLKYIWTATGPKGVAFSPNGTTASGATMATFTAAGTYTITVTTKDPAGLSASAVQTLVVQRAGAAPAATPASAAILSHATKTFAVTAVDQFGATYTPTITAASAVGGTVTAVGGKATFVAGAEAEPGSISLTVDTTPAQTLTVPVQFVTCVGEGTGLAATYFDNEDFTGTSVKRVDPQIHFGSTEWPGAVPAPGIATDWWSAIWVGSIEVPTTDTYTFATYSDDGIILMIDGKPILENWTGHGRTRDQASIALTAGKHAIQVRYYNSHGGACLDLLWSCSSFPEDLVPSCALYPDAVAPSVGGGTGLCATYFDEDQFGGFSSVRLDPQLDFVWNAQTSPATSIAPDAWSVRWVGQIEAEYTDTYTFSALTNHPFSLAINAQTVISDQADGAEHTATGKMYLQAGRRYDLVATYRSTAAPSRLTLSWSCALAGSLAGVPSAQFYPTDEAQAARIQVLSPLASYTSPAWIEGTVGHWTTAISASVNGSPVTVARAGAAPWYLTTGADGQPLGVPLSGGTNALAIASTNGSAQHEMEQVITWTTIDLAKRPYGLDVLDVRPGDSLRLTATGAGSALAIGLVPADGADFVADQSGIPGQVFVVPFSQPGVYLIAAQIDGVEVGRLTVRVPQVDLMGPIACHINYQRIKDIIAVDNGANVTYVAPDASQLQVGVRSSTDAGCRLEMRPLQSGDLAVQARLGNCGPIITQCAVDEFTLRTTAEKYIAVMETLSDGKMILQAQLIMSPLVPHLDIRLAAYTAGITFEDSSTTMWVNSNEFVEHDDWGGFIYRLIQSPGAAACHNFDVYQNGIQISHQ